MALRNPLRGLRWLRDDVRAARLSRHYAIGGRYRRVYHYHIPKTGGTSLNTMFLALGTGDGDACYQRLAGEPSHRLFAGVFVFVGWDPALIEGGRYFYGFSHIPSHRLRLPPGTFTVTCLRDPLKRVISRYTELCDYRDRGVDHPVMAVEGPDLGSSFADYLERVPRERLLAQLYMFSRGFDVGEGFDGVVGCGQFMFTEKFADGVDGLRKKLDLDLVPIHARKGPAKAPLADADRARALELLAPEYDLVERLRRYQAESGA
jgi:hypothetical protein